jgi:predicted nucleic acid-binding protein
VKNVVVDSSSIILLQKTDLLQTLLSNYSVIIAESVHRELTHVKKKGAPELAHLLADRAVQPLRHDRVYPRMDLGERDTIELHREGHGDFILIDDKKAAKYCKTFSIPFINSLLVPRIFSAVGLLSVDEYLQKFEELMSVGYYSEYIVVQAKNIGDERLKEFFP